MTEAAERLDREERPGGLASRPVSVHVERLFAALDLHPDWPALAEQDWAEAEFQSGKAGATLAAHMVETLHFYWTNPVTGERGEYLGDTVLRKPPG